MWETITILAAVVIGSVTLLLIIKRQVKRGAAGACSGCPYGSNPSECVPPADAPDVPDECEKPK
jgi:hypothetical protein